MDKEYAVKILLAEAICCSNSQEITCEICPFYVKEIANNEDNISSCAESFRLDDKIVEAIKILTI